MHQTSPYGNIRQASHNCQGVPIGSPKKECPGEAFLIPLRLKHSLLSRDKKVEDLTLQENQLHQILQQFTVLGFSSPARGHRQKKKLPQSGRPIYFHRLRLFSPSWGYEGSQGALISIHAFSTKRHSWWFWKTCSAYSCNISRDQFIWYIST